MHLKIELKQVVMSSLFGQFPNSEKPSENQDNRAIVFISSKLTGWESLVQKVVPEARVIVIGSQADGIREITKVLNSSDCQEIHIISHGSPGCFYLGNSELSINTLIQYALELKSWFARGGFHQPSTNSPQLSLYGSNVAAGDVGEEFVTKLNQITGAEITASTKIASSSILDECR